jgi:hypothetical protein
LFENLMKRLLAFLLICLLPMQVFAGLLTYRTAVDTVALQAQFDQLAQSATLLAADDVAPALTLAADDTDVDDSSDFADSDDFSTHAGVGDEPVLHLPPAVRRGSDPRRRSRPARAIVA